jgi:hypothetical protein
MKCNRTQAIRWRREENLSSHESPAIRSDPYRDEVLNGLAEEWSVTVGGWLARL